jgi:hypothetical protein
VRHAYVKMEKSGAVCIRWWVDASEGVAARTMIHVYPGERAFGLPFGHWRGLCGSFVNLDEVDAALPGAVAPGN